MNREIKTRLWDKVEKKFIDPCEFAITGEGFIRFIGWNYDKTFMVVDELRSEEKDRYDPSIFTGLHDKNGKEIYEGDIVRNGVINAYVFYDERVMSFLFIVPPIKTGSLVMNIHGSQVEIIGNIYENPELLESK